METLFKAVGSKARALRQGPHALPILIAGAFRCDEQRIH